MVEYQLDICDFYLLDLIVQFGQGSLLIWLVVGFGSAQLRLVWLFLVEL